MKHLQQILDNASLMPSVDMANYIHSWYCSLSNEEKTTANEQARVLDHLGWLILGPEYAQNLVCLKWFYPEEFDDLMIGTQFENKTIYRGDRVKLKALVYAKSGSNKKVLVDVDVSFPFIEGKYTPSRNKTVGDLAYDFHKEQCRRIAEIGRLY